MGDLLNIVTPLHQRAKDRDYLFRMIDNKPFCMKVARKYGEYYWDGDRRYGYGGYRYIEDYWKPVAEALIERYKLSNDSKVLDVGCGKAYLLYEIKKLLPGAEIRGIDISEHGLKDAKEEIKGFLRIHRAEDVPYVFWDARAEDNLKYPDKYFDLVISITTLHNLYIYDLKKALQEIERVGKQKFICVESYRDEKELFNLQCWALTCNAFFTPEEWNFLFSEFGIETDYEFLYFE